MFSEGAFEKKKERTTGHRPIPNVFDVAWEVVCVEVRDSEFLGFILQE